MRLAPGTAAPDFAVQDLDGREHTLAGYRGGPLLLQFYRFAACPMCDLRLHDFAREYPGLEERGVRVLAFFHSSPERLRRHFRKRALPFPIVGDPGEQVYRRYGVERSWARLLLSAARPRFYLDWVRSMRHGFWGGADLRMETMPADFLIDAAGTVRLAHYGADIGDHLPAERVHAALAALREGAPTAAGAPGRRLPQLLAALRGREGSGLRVAADTGDGRIHATFASPGGGQVELLIGEDGALLRATAAEDRPPRVQRVALDLGAGFVYGGLRLDSAAALADALLEDAARALAAARDTALG